MAKRWVIGGLAVGVGALVLAPEARTWLRRRLGLEPEDRRWFEEEGVETAEHEGDEPLDTREARFSLRARLAEEGHAEPEHAGLFAPTEPAPEPSPYAAFEQPAPDLALAEEPVSDEPAAEEPAAVEQPAAEEPAAEPEPEPRPMWPSAVPSEPEPEPEPSYASYEALPAITPEADEPRAPGEDTNEIDPLPSTTASDDPAEEEEPPPPTLLRPPSPFPPSRPFSGEGASFRSAIDAARERVHGAAREATPDDEGDNTEPVDERA
jgi:hypothetical protein